jgi:hypothetical protein
VPPARREKGGERKAKRTISQRRKIKYGYLWTKEVAIGEFTDDVIKGKLQIVETRMLPASSKLEKHW